MKGKKDVEISRCRCNIKQQQQQEIMDGRENNGLQDSTIDRVPQ